MPQAPTGAAFRAGELRLCLATLGFALDRVTVRRQGLDARALFSLYRLRDVRAAVAYLAPLAPTLLVVGQQLLSGNAHDAITAVLNGATAVVPGAPGR